MCHFDHHKFQTEWASAMKGRLLTVLSMACPMKGKWDCRHKGRFLMSALFYVLLSNVFRIKTEKDGRAYRQVWSSTAYQRLPLNTAL
jgi:hypothetical protein